MSNFQYNRNYDDSSDEEVNPIEAVQIFSATKLLIVDIFIFFIFEVHNKINQLLNLNLNNVCQFTSIVFISV